MILKIALILLVCGFSNVRSENCLGYGEDDGETGRLSENCLRCIHTVVSTHYDEECSATSCGPYRITYEYWQSVYSKNGQEEYNDCTKKPWCSLQTVIEHMKIFLPKCHKESATRPVCESAMALHRFGAKSCTSPLNSSDKQNLYSCMDGHTRSWLSKSFL